MYNLGIVDNQLGLNFNVKYGNLAKAKRPDIVAKNVNGDVVQLTTTGPDGKPLPKGSTQRKWLDNQNREYSKSELTFTLGEQEVSEIDQTKVLEIEGYQPLVNYTDTYIIGTYYETMPSDNGMKKDIDRDRASKGNLAQMYKLWEHLFNNNLVARAEFCPASRGFVTSDGYIRAVLFDKTKWGLEIGVFKEPKVFEHLQEGVPSEAPAVAVKSKNKIKLV